MGRLMCLFALWAACPAGSASALTVRDVVELTRAGLGEDTLLALIEVDPSVFPIDAATLTTLKAAGVSERVIVAMIRSGRWPAAGGAAPKTAEISSELSGSLPADAAPARLDPQVVIIEHHDQAPVVREVPVAVPVYIPVERPRRDDDREARDDADRPRRPAPAAPVYWGWGGKLRPDAWQPN